MKTAKSFFVFSALIFLAANVFAEQPYFGGYQLRKLTPSEQVKKFFSELTKEEDADAAVNKSLACFVKFPNYSTLVVGFENTGKKPLNRSPFASGLSIQMTTKDDAVYEMYAYMQPGDPNCVEEVAVNGDNTSAVLSQFLKPAAPLCSENVILNPGAYRESSWEITDPGVIEIVRQNAVKKVRIASLKPGEETWFDLSPV